MRVFAELGTPDLEASKAFWSAAGFTVTEYDDGFAFVGGDAVEFHLFRTSGAAEATGGAYLLVDDVDAVHRRWMAAGLAPTKVADEPWGMREFSIVDPGGNRIRVGSTAS